MTEDAVVCCLGCEREVGSAGLPAHRSRSGRHLEGCPGAPGQGVTCDDCQQRFWTRMGVFQHYTCSRCPVKPYPEAPVPCALCSKPWPPPVLRKHEAQCAAVLKRCDDCGANFFDRRAFLAHFHSAEKPCTTRGPPPGPKQTYAKLECGCGDCGKMFKGKQSLLRHHTSGRCIKHPNFFTSISTTLLLCCDHCGLRFGTRKAMTLHLREVCYKNTRDQPSTPVMSILSTSSQSAEVGLDASYQPPMAAEEGEEGSDSEWSRDSDVEESDQLRCPICSDSYEDSEELSLHQETCE